MLSKELEAAGFYKVLLERIEDGEVHTAAEMITKLDHLNQLAILFRLARALARSLAHTHELELDSELGFDLALARALTRALDSSLALVHTRAEQYDLARTTSLAFDLARTLARARARAREEKLARALAHAADYVEVTVLVLQRPTDMISLVGLDVLTPQTLASLVAPILQAVATIQEIVAQLEGAEFTEPRIAFISHDSPTEIRIEGVARALEILKGFVLPKWREYVEQQAALELQEKQLNLDHLQREVDQMQRRLQRSRFHDRLRTIPEPVLHDAEHQQLARKKFEFQQEKYEFVASLVDHLAPHLAKAQHVAYTTRLLEALNVVFDSPLDFMANV
ncbi:MAG: hypothetical protein IT324_32795 [Anaerolineae bacterium]|nr:hypothetical protein [Anaerolineae bacterium]